MTIELITGTPGSGKTCYAVAKRIVPEFGRKVVVERPGGGEDIVERRVIVAGIRGLVVAHERLPHTLTGERVSASESEMWNECDADDEPVFKRLPGDPAHIVEATLFNWWLWCRPGDLIVCDEVQFIIPRGTLGKKPPHYIKSLEIHRHYGVDFLFITQNPELLDNTIRKLVGLHRHIRSVMGSSLCMVYEWDHASNVERITHSSKAWYKRKAEYFKLYKSTVAVVAPPKSGRAILWLAPMMLCLAGVFAWYGTSRWRNPQLMPTPAGLVDAGKATTTTTQPPVGPSTRFPVYEAVPVKHDREPYASRALQFEGGYTRAGQAFGLFGMLVDGERVTSITLAELVKAGYAWTVIGPCAGVLRFGVIERLVTCAKPAKVERDQRIDTASAAASAPS